MNRSCSSYEEFLSLMAAKGYELKNTSLDPSDGKYITFRPAGRERFVRGSTKSLRKNYTKEQINERIEHKKNRTRPVFQTEKRLRQLIDMNSQNTFAGKPGPQRWASKENLKIATETYSRMTAKNTHSFTLAEVINYARQYPENK